MTCILYSYYSYMLVDFIYLSILVAKGQERRKATPPTLLQDTILKRTRPEYEGALKDHYGNHRLKALFKSY